MDNSKSTDGYSASDLDTASVNWRRERKQKHKNSQCKGYAVSAELGKAEKEPDRVFTLKLDALPRDRHLRNMRGIIPPAFRLSRHHVSP